MRELVGWYMCFGTLKNNIKSGEKKMFSLSPLSYRRPRLAVGKLLRQPAPAPGHNIAHHACILAAVGLH
jgi:hypothetical protein